jgi:hypothetical protein
MIKYPIDKPPDVQSKGQTYAGADPGFQVRGAHLKKLRRAEGSAKFLGYFVGKITILRQKIIFFPILGGARAGCAPRWIRP